MRVASAIIILAALAITLCYVNNLDAAPVTVGDFVVDYVIQSDWGNGATINVTLKNNGPAITGWILGWTFSGNQTITNLWNGTYTQNGASVSVRNANYNASISTGGSVSFGFNLNYSGTNAAPTGFTVNSSSAGTPTPTSRQTPTPTRGATPTQRLLATPTPTTRALATPTPTVRTATPTPTFRPVNSGLPVPPVTPNAPRPSGAQGGLTVVNWAGFKGAGSYTFDDNTQSQVNNFQALMNLNVPMTFYLVSNWSNASNSCWATALSKGCELGNHTKTHPQTGNGSDIDACTTFIQQTFGVTPFTMAAPYGDGSYVSLASSRFMINRGVNGGYMLPNDNTDPFNIKCNIPASNATASAMVSPFSSARSAGGWTVLLIHGFTGTSDGAYQPVSITEFTSSVNQVKAFGDMWLDTVLNIGAYWRAQKMMSSVSPTTSGSDLIYRWTLPAHFPANKYLRIKLTGGTPKQNGQVLNWDAHGYYEISLDAGSLTVSP